MYGIIRQICINRQICLLIRVLCLCCVVFIHEHEIRVLFHAWNISLRKKPLCKLEKKKELKKAQNVHIITAARTT
jgi:hypothetical protein